MKESLTHLPHLLEQSPGARLHVNLERLNLEKLRKAARVWGGLELSKQPKDQLVSGLHAALQDPGAASRVLESLSASERAVASVYRRYGAAVDGEVLRLELLSRGLLKIKETKYSKTYTSRQWERNLVKELQERWILLGSSGELSYYYRSAYGDETRSPFGYLYLEPSLAEVIEPAGPAPWSVAPWEGPVDSITRRSVAEVALDFSRLLSFIEAKGSVKLRKDRALSTPALRALEKAVPIDDDPEFHLPHPHVLLLDILRDLGVFRSRADEIFVDPEMASKIFAQPDIQQLFLWTRGWLNSLFWVDGKGMREPYELNQSMQNFGAGRKVLAWALNCLAQQGNHWYELNTFLSTLRSLQGENHLYLPTSLLAWDPGEALGGEENRLGGTRRPGQARSDEGLWYANVLMVTFVALGLLERGRLGRAKNAPYAFRLTELGRAVFGAPEIPIPAPSAVRPFLVVQPNFDLLAYVDQADASSIGYLGRIAERTSGLAGPVQTFRLTQQSIYRAEESGLDHAQVVAFLERSAQGTPPANVLRSLADWTGKRESLVLRSGGTLLAFASSTERDAYQKRHSGIACGERFLFAEESKPEPSLLKTALVIDHTGVQRSSWTLDESGAIRATKPLDIVQQARLRRIASPKGSGWQLSGDSLREGVAASMKPALVERWLSSHLDKPLPPLISQAIKAWLGKTPSLELAEALLLHIPGDDAFQAIANSPRLRRFLLNSPGTRWLIVRPESRKQLVAELEKLGFHFEQQFTLTALDETL